MTGPKYENLTILAPKARSITRKDCEVFANLAQSASISSSLVWVTTSYSSRIALPVDRLAQSSSGVSAYADAGLH